MLSQKRRPGYHFPRIISYAPSACGCLFPRTTLSKLTTSAENQQKPRDIRILRARAADSESEISRRFLVVEYAERYKEE